MAVTRYKLLNPGHVCDERCADGSHHTAWTRRGLYRRASMAGCPDCEMDGVCARHGMVHPRGNPAASTAVGGSV
jgi:hypothetical protein